MLFGFTPECCSPSPEYAFSRRNAVNVDADQTRHALCQEGAGLFHDFAPGRLPDLCIGPFDVAARQQPAIEAIVVNQQD
jgi:hypothetical protein